MMDVLSRLVRVLLLVPLVSLAQQKITWEKYGSEMVLTRTGTFEMGDHHDGLKTALPVHTVELDAFYMDVNEITAG